MSKNCNQSGVTELLLRLISRRRIFLVRHGAVIKHKERIYLGQYDLPLSEEGSKQIEETANRLKACDIKTGVIYSSDLVRAFDSAKIIAYKLENKTIKTVSGLREIALGSWDGRFISEIIHEYPAQYELRGKSLLTYKIDEQSETFLDLQLRVLDCFIRLLETDSHDDILLVSHSGPIKIIRAAIIGSSLERDLTDKHLIGNGQYFKFPF